MRRYLAVYSHMVAGRAVFGNVDITTDGPVDTISAVRKVEAQIEHDYPVHQVVLVNLLQLFG